jgi:hypothetical protein
MKKLPLGIQDFSKLIRRDCIYADKTKIIYDLIQDGQYYFLSRPRRFGKSLLLSTMEEMFKGNRDLFAGTWIHGSDFEFEEHPVIRLSMDVIEVSSPEALKSSLETMITNIIDGFGVTVNGETAGQRFNSLFQILYEKYGSRVVLLIDEYDKPILDVLTKPIVEDVRIALREIYSKIKNNDEYIEFCFITGITKLSQMSIFSDLNNLTDITFVRQFNDICGFNYDELDYVLSQRSEVLDREGILHWYNGYSWDGENKVINPLSLFKYIYEGRFKSFWYATGTPRFLLDLMQKRGGIYLDDEDLRIKETSLDVSDINHLNITSLLFQSGYLTIVSRENEYCNLDFPNREVREAYTESVLMEFTGVKYPDKYINSLRTALQSEQIKDIENILANLYASIPYELLKEVNLNEYYYHSIFFLILKVVGKNVRSEISSSKGRADIVIELLDTIYVIEMKYTRDEKDIDKKIEEALNQLAEKRYADSYLASDKKIIQLAVCVADRSLVRIVQKD